MRSVTARLRDRDDAGLSTVELSLTVLIVAILMAAAMSWAASTNRAAQGGVDRALADAEIGTVIEALGRDARSAQPVTSAASAPIITSLDVDTLVLHHDRNDDGVPNQVVWDRATGGGPLVRTEYAGIAGTGPNWSFEAAALSQIRFFTEVTSAGVFEGVRQDGSTFTTCDATVDPGACTADGIRLELTYLDDLGNAEADLEAAFTFRNEVGTR